MTHAEVIASFDSIDGQLAVGGLPLERLAARVGASARSTISSSAPCALPTVRSAWWCPSPSGSR